MNLKNKNEKIVHCGQPARARVQADPIVGAQLEESRPNPKLLWLDKSKSQIIQSPHPYVVHTISFTHSGFGSVLQC